VKRNENQFPISVLCKVLQVSRHGYYAWKKRARAASCERDKVLLNKIMDAYSSGRGTYGYRRVYSYLSEKGVGCSLGTVRRIMHNHGIFRKASRKYKHTTDSNHNLPVAPNLLNREFSVDAPNKVWVSDITYVWTLGGWLYLAVFIDLFHRKVVGWSMNTRMSRKLVIDAFDMAYANCYPKPGLMVHSDRGSQYASVEFRKKIEKLGFKQSMSRKGDCWDNAVAESFFATLKTELIYRKKYKNISDARRSIFSYVEGYYNRERIHSSLGYMSPEQFENKYKLGVAA
jgi:transposase InsO family protein